MITSIITKKKKKQNGFLITSHLQMEVLVREMQDQEHGVPVRQQKMFLTSIPYAFMGN